VLGEVATSKLLRSAVVCVDGDARQVPQFGETDMVGHREKHGSNSMSPVSVSNKHFAIGRRKHLCAGNLEDGLIPCLLADSLMLDTIISKDHRLRSSTLLTSGFQAQLPVLPKIKNG
jgi:hypothetical protein